MRRLALLLLTACHPSTGHLGASDHVADFSSDDAQMNAAVAEARANVATFTAALTAPGLDQSMFLVKAGLTEGGYTEHVWLSPVSLDGSAFSGPISDDVVRVHGWKKGDVVRVTPQAVSDWMYVDSGRLVGGYTIRVMRAQMSPEERAAFDAEMPFRIEP